MNTASFRHWVIIALVTAVALPALILRSLIIADAPHPDLGAVGESVLFGLGILAAALLLTWASEVAETEISQTLALAAIALIAVLPEYAVDVYFAWTAPHEPDNAHLAIANMTGGNRLLVGFAWPLIFLVFWLKTKRKFLPVGGQNSVGILFLGVATLYSFSIPIRGHLSLLDTGVMFTLFGVYLYFSSRTPAREVDVFVGPAQAIAALPLVRRRVLIVLIFLYAAAVIFASAEPFAEGLVHTGEKLGVDEFILVQWVAPLASESPEFLLAALLAARGRAAAGMSILISSKVNQWTVLIGSLPLAYSISGTTLSPLDFDSRQAEEVFLTAGQSLFAVVIFISLSMSLLEAALLAVLFLTQLFFLDTTVRLGYGVGYISLALFLLLRQLSVLPAFLKVTRSAVVDPHTISSESPLEELVYGKDEKT
ncbi:MAG TPA: sodium:calcium antiporter [Dehalococcoidia bacterium]|nr:sodium:calcium antiporter [Dehalococcoidia bacterium]